MVNVKRKRKRKRSTVNGQRSTSSVNCQPSTVHFLHYYFFLISALVTVTLPSENGGIHFSEPPAEIQPHKLRVAQPVAVLPEINRFGIGVTGIRPEYVTHT